MKRNIKLTLEYDGTNYLGFQKQPQGQTIQGELEKALKNLLQEEIKVIGASRTDAGVHALKQVVNFKTASSLSLRRIQKGLNGLLPEDIVVKNVEEVEDSFDARRDAIEREYKYYILNRDYPSALNRYFVYYVPTPLNISMMRKALKYIEGTHDFSSFCVASSAQKGSCVRKVNKAMLERKEEGLIVVTLRANSFVHQMVRSIIGTLIEIGREKIKPGEMKRILEKKDRKVAGPTVPARALFLTEVDYG